ncbi:MAG: ATP-dependent DNA helicase RecG [Bacteroidetes bacterium]|nr:ATP-dependent DNA helicase RecG [Bacteroidota bacterium]
MENKFLSTPIEYLKGVGPQKAELIKAEINVFTYFDLIHYFPNRYVDKSKISNIADINDDTTNVQLRGKLFDITIAGTKQGKRLIAVLEDKTGNIELTWFKNFQYVAKTLKEGAFYTVFGKINDFKGKISIVHPEIKLYSIEDNESGLNMEPVYPLTEKLKARFMDSKFFMNAIKQILVHSEFDLSEYIPESVSKPLKLIPRKHAYYFIHLPKKVNEQLTAERRIKFDEMFTLAMRNEKNKITRLQEQKGIKMLKVGDNFNTFYKECLSFELTNAQKKVIKEIKADISNGNQMNRLLQGDVGSGKTVVALLCMLMAIDNGYQTCLMAPTEILATQHYFTIKDMLGNLPINIKLLTGSTTKKNRQAILEQLNTNEINILIGTHALIEDDVTFSKLGFVVIDEQHRFGVAQRSRLWNKSSILPHVLVMTATPIPRTLAMTVHGELDVSVINELPKDRKPIKTLYRDESFRADIMAFVDNELKKGRQAYIVYPLIEESSKLDLNDLMNGYDVVCSYFPIPKYQISLLHGKMKADVKELEMQRFKAGITQIMISTTVIEVGVNVPNASVMVIENANRFGLSQLHQLRGRVGRGAEQSFCILMSKENLNYTSKKRINTMCKTNNGFEISEVDLELRGPGDLLGTRQSGLPDFKLLDLVKDDEIIDLAKRAANFILKNDPALALIENKILLEYLQKHQQDNFWGRVS